MKSVYFSSLFFAIVLSCQFRFVTAQPRTLLFDVSHGQQARIALGWKELILDSTMHMISVNESPLSGETLKATDVLVLFSPTSAFTASEKEAIRNYVNSGGSLLLIFDEERRTPISVGVNDLIAPFGMELTENAPVPHNCGAVAEKSIVCKERRELPYSGGRSIKGGTAISKVYDDADYTHSAYVDLNSGGRIMVMSDGMAGLLMGGPDGVRFSGTNPSDSKYWGKDSEAFMKEVLTFVANKR